ncbi:MAG: hypothetical protein BGO55_27755 [Sphingobacteriales bacterium 50-39]|nr:hypothetical protein [Sphingobacteriales bacterium]OJW56839.1 MAG: hypothetical protein BGO55_27755 [Sphingobacteriales bacterium 50-39]
MLNRNAISQGLYDFEGVYFEDIKGKKIRGFNAWQIVKSPLFFELIRVDTGSAVTKRRSSAGIARKVFLKLYSILTNLAYSLVSWIRFSVKKSKGLVLLAAFSADKPSRLKDGRYFNFLVDPFVSGNMLDRYVYAEESFNGDFKEPSFVPADFRIDRFNFIIDLYQRFFCRKKDTVRLAEEIAGMLNEHFKRSGGDLKINAASLAGTLQRFDAEYTCWKILLGSLRPALIISSEKPGTGFMAAALSLGIPFIDLQHGLIDRCYPQYIYHPVMRSLKGELVIPAYVGVFGRMHQDILLSNGFWDSKEVPILGSSKVEMNRSAFAGTGTAGNLILLPTQWTCFEETKAVLNALTRMDAPGFKIVLKLHPLEPDAYVEYYRNLALEKKDMIAFADRDVNIYELILQARLVVGFDSTVLLEAVSLGRPCITLTTPNAPKGILSLVDAEGLSDAIRAVAYDDPGSLSELLSTAVTDENYYQECLRKTAEVSDYLYSKEYYHNCGNLISGILNN